MLKMNNHRNHSQFQPPFRAGSLPDSESDTIVSFMYPRLPVTGLLPELPPVYESTKQFEAVSQQSWNLPVTPVPPARPAFRFRSAVASKLVQKKIIAVVSLIVLLGIAGFLLMNARASATDVTLYQVSAQNTTQYTGGGGTVFPRQQLSLAYSLPERAVAVFVKAGDQVSPDQALLRLDPTQLNAQVKQEADDVAAAQAYLTSVSTNGTATSIAQAQQQYTLVKNKYNALVAESSSLLLHNGNLISPMNGVVTAVNINPGEVFAADTPLLVIMDEATVIVHVKVPLANLAQIHSGQQAIVTPSALPDLNLKGTVSAIVPQADPQTDTFEVWVSVENPNRALLPGMSAFVRIQSSGRAFVVPRLGILNPDRGPIAFVVRDQHVYIQHVHVTGHVGDALLVDDGLLAGDRIVLVGQYKLRSGQDIRVQSVEK
jgi:RND family efflux transporter MFP subunit